MIDSRHVYNLLKALLMYYCFTTAHELKTPIQPILSLTGVLQLSINRNAMRLQRLLNDIPDVTNKNRRQTSRTTQRLQLNVKVVRSSPDTEDMIWFCISCLLSWSA